MLCRGPRAAKCVPRSCAPRPQRGPSLSSPTGRQVGLSCPVLTPQSCRTLRGTLSPHRPRTPSPAPPSPRSQVPSPFLHLCVPNTGVSCEHTQARAPPGPLPPGFGTSTPIFVTTANHPTSQSSPVPPPGTGQRVCARSAALPRGVWHVPLSSAPRLQVPAWWLRCPQCTGPSWRSLGPERARLAQNGGRRARGSAPSRPSGDRRCCCDLGRRVSLVHPRRRKSVARLHFDLWRMIHTGGRGGPSLL